MGCEVNLDVYDTPYRTLQISTELSLQLNFRIFLKYDRCSKKQVAEWQLRLSKVLLVALALREHVTPPSHA